jgi:SAM-dependent methyltransferase
VWSGFASFRDPDGSVLFSDRRVFRLTTPAGFATVRAVLKTPAAQRLLGAGHIVPTSFVPAEIARSLAPTWLSDESWELLEHERIPFPSYPYEWPADMLHAAAGLTVEIARELLPCGFGIKDATPYNVLFRGPKPVFVDVASFEPRNPRDPLWLPYAQFVRTFLLPLAANRQLGIPLNQVFLTRRDGLEPEEVYRWLPISRRIRPPFLAIASLPVWLARHRDAREGWLYRPRAVANEEKARFILGSLLTRLHRTVNRLQPRAGRISCWSGYAEANSYSPVAAAAKTAFIEKVFSKFHPRRVLDVGANTGRFSELAAAHSASVVAVDSDPIVVGALWRTARATSADILPLVVDITRPSPPMGWCNRECASFLARCRGYFDAVLMLALLHHLLVTERIPLAELIDLAAELTTDLAILEWVGSGDPMFQRLVRGRDRLYGHVTEAAFQSIAARRFSLVWRQPLDGMERTIYVLRKRLLPGESH